MSFLKRKEEHYNLFISEENKRSFRILLQNISLLLNNAKHDAQAKVVLKISEQLEQEDNVAFVKMMNGVDMWGGSGAVWEVWIDNEELRRQFNHELIALIDLMRKSDIMISYGIEPIRDFFKKEVYRRKNYIGMGLIVVIVILLLILFFTVF